MTYETLLVDVTDGVATVTLNRPEVRNALSATLLRELEETLATLEANRRRGSSYWPAPGTRPSAPVLTSRDFTHRVMV